MQHFIKIACFKKTLNVEALRIAQRQFAFTA